MGVLAEGAFPCERGTGVTRRPQGGRMLLGIALSQDPRAVRVLYFE